MVVWITTIYKYLLESLHDLFIEIEMNEDWLLRVFPEKQNAGKDKDHAFVGSSLLQRNKIQAYTLYFIVELPFYSLQSYILLIVTN